MDKYGQELDELCNDKRIVTDWALAEGVFEPIISNDSYKILGWKLNGTHNISIRTKNVDKYHEIKVSNKFSGLTVQEAKAKIKRLNAQNGTNDKLEKTTDGYILHCNYINKIPATRNPIDATQFYSFERCLKINFKLDKNNKLVSDILTNIKESNPQYLAGTSFSAPIIAVESVLKTNRIK